MQFIMDILKGAVMGIANVIPGVSGGTMAVAMGIYDRLIHALTHIISEFKKSIMSLIPIGLGMGIGILGLARLIEWMYGVVPIQTNFLFIGLIIGGLPVIVGKVKTEKVKAPYLLGFILFFALVIVMAVLTGTKGADADGSINILNMLLLFFVGVIASATMVIPGVSGSMMMMLLGYYNPIMVEINRFMDGVKAMDIALMGSAAAFLVPFGIGVVVGIVAIAKLIEFLFERYSTPVYWCIIGLICASPIAIIIIMLKQDNFPGWSVMPVVTGVIALAVGFVISMFLGGDHKEAKKEQDEKNE